MGAQVQTLQIKFGGIKVSIRRMISTKSEWKSELREETDADVKAEIKEILYFEPEANIGGVDYPQKIYGKISTHDPEGNDTRGNLDARDLEAFNERQ